MNLKKWIGITDSLKLKKTKLGVRGIITNKTIPTGMLIISIPSEFMITASKIEKNKYIAKLLDIKSILKSPVQSLIATYLYICLYKKNIWYPYIKTLPNVTNYPIFMNKIEKDLISDSLFGQEIKRMEDSHLHDYTIIINNIDPVIKNNFSLKMFNICKIWTVSRIFNINSDISGLVPYADLINHSSKNNILYTYNKETDTFDLIATKLIKKGQELLNNYGTKSNEQLLLNYNFILPKNKSRVIINHKNNKYYFYDSNNDTFNDNSNYLSINENIDIIDAKKILKNIIDTQIVKNKNILKNCKLNQQKFSPCFYNSLYVIKNENKMLKQIITDVS